MSRKRRALSPTGIYHWIVRGMNRRKIFHKKSNFQKFYELLEEYKDIFNIKIYHYCFMTNHVHMLIYAEDLETLAKFSQYVQRRYAYYYCKTYKWSGSIFRQGYRSLPVKKDSHLIECARYIERNPVKAKMVKRVEEYEYSSYRFYAYGNRDRILTKSPGFLGLANTEEARRRLYIKKVTEVRIQEEMLEERLLPTFEF